MSEGKRVNSPSEQEESERDKASASQGEIDPLSSESVAAKVEKFGGSSYLSRGFQQVCGVASQIVKVGSSNLVHTAPSTLSKASASASASSSHSTADQTTTIMADVDTTREFLDLEVSHFDQIEGKLRTLMKKKDYEPSQIQVQLQLLRAKLEDVNITRQDLIRLLLEEKKTTESSKEKQDQYGLIEKLMTIECEITALQKNPSSADGVTTPVVDVEAQLYIKASETMEHHLDYLEEKLNNEVREECEDQMDVALLRWEYFQQRYKDRAVNLRSKGDLKELEKLEDRRIELKQKKVELERKYCAFMGVESVPTTTGESTSSSHHEYSSDLRALRHDRKDLPKLGGNVKDWLPFWSLFEEVDSDRKLSNIRKFQLLLKSTVEGSEARAIVDSYTVSGKNYKAALQHLEDLYGRESVLIKVYVRELLQISLDRSMGKKTELRQLVTAITAQIRNLEMLGATEDKTALVIYPMVETCLPSHVLSAWQHDPNYSGDDLGLLMAFLQQEVSHEMERNLAKFQFQSSSSEKKNNNHDSKKGKGSSKGTPTAVSFHNKEKSSGCIFCAGRHPSKECRKSKDMDFEEKSERVKKGGACFVCLEVGHMSRSCPNRERVKCSVCQKPHFQVLCRKSGSQSSNNNNRGGGGGGRSNNNDRSSSEGSSGNQSPPQPSAPPAATVDFNNSILSPDVPLQILILKVKGATGRTRVVRALLDSGSQKSYVVESLHRELQFSKIGEEEVSHQLFGGTTTAPQKHEVVKLHVTGVVEEAPCAFDVSCVPTISDNIPAARGGPWISEFQRRGVVLQPQMESTRIELLIGNDVAPRLYTGRKEDLGTGPVALETRWGWVLCGKLPPSPQRRKNSSMVNITTTLMNLPITSLWDLEALGIQDAATKQSKEELDSQTQQHFEENVSRTDEGRYQVALPFLAGAQELLPTNYFAAERRLKSTTSKIRQQGYLEKYDDLFQQWEKDGMIEDVTEEDDKEVGHYLPHRAVIKLSSATTPIRPVFDASAKPKGKPSLNECLEAGPNLLELIPSLLTRFRMDRVGVTADIKKAFMQIEVKEDHRKYLKFLWWKDSSCTQLKVYRHTRVVFGVTSSPFLLGATLIHLLKQSPPSYSKTAEQLIESLYVDNVVASTPSLESGRFLQQQSCELLEPAKFDMRGWEFGPKEGGGVIPILGLKWDTEADTLTYDLKPAIEKIGVGNSQRAVLSLAHMLYDPIGVLAPFTILAKLIVRQCHQEKLGWDRPLPPQLEESFRKWSIQIPVLEQVILGRYSSYTAGEERSLHVFTDASSEIFAAVVFLRVKTTTGVVVSLQQAKARVAPKNSTIPRLELLGCLIGSRLAKQVRSDLKDQEIPTTYWTDSSTALAWITGDGPWAVFVNNRVKEIRELTRPEEWRHVPGKLNPADLPSRGCSASKLVESKWWLGPDWLHHPEASWPKTVRAVDEEAVVAERRKTVVTNMVTTSNPIMEKFIRISTYPRMMNAVAIWMRVRNNLINRAHRRKNNLLPAVTVPVHISEEERSNAETFIIRHCQRRLLEEPTRISKLRPFQDQDGVWRTKTRLLLEEEVSINPIILPDDEEITRRIIRHIHEDSCHVGTQLLLAKVRERFWLINGRRAVRKIVKACWICRRFQAKTLEVEEPPLPIARTAVEIPFHTTGVDMAGPLFLKNKSKVWVALFTCASYRAVHMEIVDSLSTDSFFVAFRNFVARRGRPAIVYSDNGLNFTGANTALQKVYRENVRKFAEERRIDWRHIVPTGAWHGGWWERLIGVAKDLLRKILGRREVHHKELEVLLMEIEEALNNRPLTYLAENPDDPIAITPNMLVRNSGLAYFPELNIRDSSSLKAAYKRVQHLREVLHSRFRKEYLGQLRFQRKRMATSRTLQPGDVVLVHHPNEKRLNWPLGVVVAAVGEPGRAVYRYRIRTRGGILERPPQHLFPMECAEVAVQQQN